MHSETPTNEPTVVRAGDTWKWQKNAGDHTPAAGWALKYALHNIGSASASGTKLQITATAAANNIDWDVSVPAATTAPLLAGNWKWIAFVVKATDRFVIDTGVVFVEPDLDAAAAGTQQSQNEKMLAAIQSVLSGRATSDIESYQIAGRAVNKIPIAELVKLESLYLAKVKQERNPGRFGTVHLATFVRTST